MLREEEDDLTQEMRQLVMQKVNEELLTFIAKIEEAKPSVETYKKVGAIADFKK